MPSTSLIGDSGTVTRGGCRVAGDFPITDSRLPLTDYRSPITDYRSPITDLQGVTHGIRLCTRNDIGQTRSAGIRRRSQPTTARYRVPRMRLRRRLRLCRRLWRQTGSRRPELPGLDGGRRSARRGPASRSRDAEHRGRAAFGRWRALRSAGVGPRPRMIGAPAEPAEEIPDHRVVDGDAIGPAARMYN